MWQGLSAAAKSARDAAGKLAADATEAVADISTTVQGSELWTAAARSEQGGIEKDAVQHIFGEGDLGLTLGCDSELPGSPKFISCVEPGGLAAAARLFPGQVRSMRS